MGLLLYRLGLLVERTWWLNRLVTLLERQLKGTVFGCQMCGQCALSQTALTCPMTCPKQLRNGPCGGSVSGKCEVYPEMDCVWTTAYYRSKWAGRGQAFHFLMLPVDHRLMGTSSWINHVLGRDSHTYGARDVYLVAEGRVPLPAPLAGNSGNDAYEPT